MANVLTKTLIAGATAATVVAGVAMLPTTADARPFGYGHYGYGGGFGYRGLGYRGFYGPRVGWGYGRGVYGRGFYGRGFGVGFRPGFYGGYGYGPRWGYGYRGPYSWRAIF